MKNLILLTLLLLINSAARSQSIDRIKLLADIKILSSEKFAGRKTGTLGNRLAADFIAGRFTGIGLSPYQDSFKQPFTFQDGQDGLKKGTNLVGYVKGNSDQIIVISAHYDHLGSTGTQTYYGADDNASGIAAMLAFAEYFRTHRPEHTLVFAAFDGEEYGLKGAEAFLKTPVINKDRIAMNVNMDMIAHNDKGELYAAGAYRHPALKDIIKNADQNTGVKIIFGHDSPDSGKDDWTMQSDQGPFAEQNIPFVYFGVEDHKDYHKPTDTFDNINPDFYYAASTAILRAIIKLDAGVK